jgi:hypothetical protein
MNDRLKQLCEHSKAYATECTKHFTGDEPVVWMDYYTEKFAQLIVAHATECVRDVLREENSDLTYPAATQVQNRIKQYFGVEY